MHNIDNKRLILIIEIIGIIILLLCAVISETLSIPFEHFSANPISELGKPFYFGILNKLGVIFWCASAITSFFTYLILTKAELKIAKRTKFLLFSTIFFGYFLTDEIFELHGTVLPNFFGIKQLIVLLLYAIISIIYLVYFRDEIFSSKYIFLILAILLLGISVLTDIASHLKLIDLGFRYILDDGSKFMGTVNLFIYFINYGLDTILINNKNIISE